MPITKIARTNLVPEIFQQPQQQQKQHFINTYTNPEGCHISNLIRQIMVSLANEPLKVLQPLVESSSEMDNLQCITNTARSPVTIIIEMGTNVSSQEI